MTSSLKSFLNFPHLKIPVSLNSLSVSGEQPPPPPRFLNPYKPIKRFLPQFYSARGIFYVPRTREQFRFQQLPSPCHASRIRHELTTDRSSSDTQSPITQLTIFPKCLYFPPFPSLPPLPHLSPSKRLNTLFVSLRKPCSELQTVLSFWILDSRPARYWFNLISLALNISINLHAIQWNRFLGVRYKMLFSLQTGLIK